MQGDEEKKLAGPVDGTTISGTAPKGESVLVVERSTPKVVGIVPSDWKVMPLEGAKIESDPITMRSGFSSVIALNPYKLEPDPKQAPICRQRAGLRSLAWRSSDQHSRSDSLQLSSRRAKTRREAWLSDRSASGRDKSTSRKFQ
jgi:hypothetical protein